MMATNVTMKASIFRMPNFCRYNKRKVSNTVMLTPQNKGKPVSNCIPMAIPNTSARSVAAMAISAKIHKMKLIGFGYASLLACAKSRPRTMPSLADKPCSSKAIKLLMSNTHINEYPNLLPPAISVAQFPGSM